MNGRNELEIQVQPDLSLTLAQVGGWMGFCVGASVFSVIEVLVLVIALTWKAVDRAISALK